MDNYIPLNIVALGARGVKNQKQLSDIFYRSVITGVNRVATTANYRSDLAKAATKYSPWVAKKITEAAGVVFGPIALASDLYEKGLKLLIERLGYSNIDYLVGSEILRQLVGLDFTHFDQYSDEKKKHFREQAINYMVERQKKTNKDILVDGHSTLYNPMNGVFCIVL
jgi:hypothetical protein